MKTVRPTKIGLPARDLKEEHLQVGDVFQLFI